ncbi:hypothetical protein CLU79DRAFT_870658, partial [Phycomyces nitens]
IVDLTISGDGICGLVYHNEPTEHNDNTRADITYYPQDNAKNLAPVIVEIQKKVTHEFIARLIRYSLSVFDQTKTLPIILVFNIDGFSSKNFRSENFAKSDNEPFYTLPSTLWAKRVRLYNADSISSLLEEKMSEMIGLVHFLTQQEKHIVALDEYKDPYLQNIYRIVSEIFNQKSNRKVIQDNQIESFCDTIVSQLKKVIHNNKSDDQVSRKRVAKYALDVISFAEHFRRLCTEEEESANVTPIATIESEDFVFVKNFIKRNPGKMKWESC